MAGSAGDAQEFAERRPSLADKGIDLRSQFLASFVSRKHQAADDDAATMIQLKVYFSMCNVS
jgi:hypothetical protein